MRLPNYFQALFFATEKTLCDPNNKCHASKEWTLNQRKQKWVDESQHDCSLKTMTMSIDQTHPSRNHQKICENSICDPSLPTIDYEMFICRILMDDMR